MIRAARVDEVAALHRLAALTFPLACPPSVTEADQAAFVAEHLSESAFARYLADPRRAVLVAEDAAGDLSGYSLLVFDEPSDLDVRAVITARPAAELSKCYVHPAAHGQGTASALMAASLSLAHDRGAVVLWLGVNAQNMRAQRFYAKEGFAQAGTKRFRVGARLEHDLVLARPL